MGFFGRKKKLNVFKDDSNEVAAVASTTTASSSSSTAVAEAAAAAATERSKDPSRDWQPPPRQYVELGSIRYANLTSDGRHGDYQTALEVAAQTGRPIFANFVEWSG